MGRPTKTIPQQWKEIVDTEWEKQRVNALYLERAITVEKKLRIPHNTIHRIMLERAMQRAGKQKEAAETMDSL